MKGLKGTTREWPSCSALCDWSRRWLQHRALQVWVLPRICASPGDGAATVGWVPYLYTHMSRGSHPFPCSWWTCRVSELCVQSISTHNSSLPGLRPCLPQ